MFELRLFGRAWYSVVYRICIKMSILHIEVYIPNLPISNSTRVTISSLIYSLDSVLLKFGYSCYLLHASHDCSMLSVFLLKGCDIRTSFCYPLQNPKIYAFSKRVQETHVLLYLGSHCINRLRITHWYLTDGKDLRGSVTWCKMPFPPWHPLTYRPKP